MPRARIHPQNCVVCGGQKARRDASRCRPCYDAGRNLNAACIDCGVAISGGGGEQKRERCWGCWSAFRKANTPTECSEEGCDKPPYAKGICRSHYQVGRRRNFWGDTVADSDAHAWVKQQPCQVCHYSRMPSHVHRPTAKGPYIVGNMVAVCVRCHEEIHRGITPCPPAIVPPEDLPRRKLRNGKSVVSDHVAHP